MRTGRGEEGRKFEFEFRDGRFKFCCLCIETESLGSVLQDVFTDFLLFGLNDNQ